MNALHHNSLFSGPGPGSLDVGHSVMTNEDVSKQYPGDLFDDDQRYYESVSVDLEQEEFNKL